MHLRAVSGMPCPTPRLRVPYALMVNVIGKGTADDTLSIIQSAYSVAGAGIHWYGKSECRVGRKMAHITLTAQSLTDLIHSADQLGVERSKHGLLLGSGERVESKLSGFPTPRVGIIMGSDSDLPTMQGAAEILDQFLIPYELTIVSAHRTPNRLYAYAQSAVDRGIQVIIAGAGGAAHLPGMVAALTPLPVIGVPVKTSTLQGQDSLLSIVQMPKGIPVATVAIGNGANAGLLAVRILGVGQGERGGLLKQMEEFMSEQEEEVLRKAVRLETIGYEKYLAEMKG
jgi:phosphoribosylaminoimidazole carboxylase